VEYFETLGLVRVDVPYRHAAAGSEIELEGEQLTVGARGRLEEGEPLAGDGIRERVAWLEVGFVGHGASEAGARETHNGCASRSDTRASKVLRNGCDRRAARRAACSPRLPASVHAGSALGDPDRGRGGAERGRVAARKRLVRPRRRRAAQPRRR